MSAQQVTSAAWDSGVEPGGFWNEPTPIYWNQALAELGLNPPGLQRMPEAGQHGIPMGVSPTVDAVYIKAWELQLAAESPLWVIK